MKIGTFASSIVKRIVDNFNRVTSGSLGTATSGQTWDAIRGVWFANGTKAQSTDAASTNPIATIPFGSSATITADVDGGGVGIAFWQSDANNWWASVPNYIQVSDSVFTCDAVQVTSTSNPPSGSCCSAVTSTPGGQVCNAGYTSSTNSSIFCSITGTSGGGSVCDQNLQTQTSTSGFCGGYSTNPGSSVCNQNYSTGLSSKTGCNPNGCDTYTTYFCPSGGDLSGTTCNVPSQSFFQGTSNQPARCQNEGGIYQGSGICFIPGYSYSASSSTTYGCYLSSTVTPTTYTGYTAYSYPPVIYYGYTSTTQQPTQYSCFTQYTETIVTTYTTQIKMISSVSGNIVTESSSSIVIGSPTVSPIQSMKVAMADGTVTTTAYSSPGLVNQLGSPLVNTPASPSTAPGVGIIKTTSDYNQGATLDNFEATI